MPVQLGHADVGDQLGPGDVEELHDGAVPAHHGHQVVRGDVGDDQLGQVGLGVQTVGEVAEGFAGQPNITQI